MEFLFLYFLIKGKVRTGSDGTGKEFNGFMPIGAKEQARIGMEWKGLERNSMVLGCGEICL